MHTWYAQRAGQQYGPFDDVALVELVRHGQIGEEDWLTSDFGGHWQQARTVAGLFPHAHAGTLPGMSGAVPVQTVVPSQVVPTPLAAIALQTLAPGARPGPVSVAPVAGAPVPSAPVYGGPAPPAAGALPMPFASPTATTRTRRSSVFSGLRWMVLVLLLVLLLLFWYGLRNPVPHVTGAATSGAGAERIAGMGA